MLRAAAGSLLGPIARRLTGARPRVLFYHRFGADERRAMSPDVFAGQLAYLRRRFVPMRLADVVRRLAAGEPVPRRAVVVTVDDGYRDFAEFAYPELVRYEIPATLYVVSRFATGELWLWFDRLRYVCEESRRPSVTVATPEVHLSLSFDTGPSREASWDRIATRCLSLPPAAREALIAEFARTAEVVVPTAPPERFAPLDLAGLARLDPALVEIGAHTRSHPILSTCSDAKLRDEIEGSRQDLEAALGRRVPSFCYPNGRPEDYDARALACVREAGFSSATVSTGMFVGPGADVLALPRLGAAGTLRTFRHELDGLTFLQAHVPGLSADHGAGEIAGRASYALL